MIEKKYPTFIVAGGVRCATGWIRECLSEHPDIYMQEKETHFFDQNYEKGGNWYSNFFNVSENFEIIGEKTASYLHIENVAKNIKELIPDITKSEQESRRIRNTCSSHGVTGGLRIRIATPLISTGLNSRSIYPNPIDSLKEFHASEKETGYEADNESDFEAHGFSRD